MRTPVFLLCAALLLAVAGPAAAEQVDVELVLAVDISGSMDRDEQILQRTGYIAAITHPDVLEAIAAGLTGRIAVTYTEWAGSGAQRVAVPWRLIDGPASAAAFAAELSAAPLGTMRGTSISGGLLHAGGLFDDNGFEGLKRVIDVSGDGPNNMGPTVDIVRDGLVAAGVVINGLPITLKPSNNFGSPEDLDLYYRNCVIGGPGAFTVPVTDPRDLAEGIRRKMILEIADLGGGFDAAFARPVADPGFDCTNRRRPEWWDTDR